MAKEKWLDEDTDLNLLDYVSKFKEKLYYACKVAQDNLKHVQHRMKVWYYKNAKVTKFLYFCQSLVNLYKLNIVDHMK